MPKHFYRDRDYTPPEFRSVLQAMSEDAASVPPFADESPEAQAARIKKASTDPLYFMETYFPHYFSSGFGKMHRRWIRAVRKARTDKALALLCAHRGSGKSAVMSMGFACWLFLFRHSPLTLLISKTEQHAALNVSAVRAELDHNARLRYDFGSVKGDIWSNEMLVSSAGACLLARGVGQQVRGYRFRQYRPTAAICDDLDDKEVARNPARVTERFNWLKSELFGAVDLVGQFYLLLVGNVFAEHCVMRLCLDDTDGAYVTEIDPAIRNGTWDPETRAFTAGTPSWPERYDLDSLSALRRLVGSYAWEAEFQHNPQGSLTAFPKDLAVMYEPAQVRGVQHAYMAIDPSATAHGDPKAQVVVEVAGGVRYVRFARIRQESDARMIAATFRLFERFVPRAVGLEDEANQRLYVPLYRAISLGENTRIGGGRWKGIHLPFRLLKTGGVNKFARITALSGDYEAGLIQFASSDAGDMPELLEQLWGLENTLIHDDGPDALEMADRLARPVALAGTGAPIDVPRPRETDTRGLLLEQMPLAGRRQQLNMLL